MPPALSRILIVGAGSAGLLSALTVRRLMPQATVALLRSSKIPVIGVGESTTAALPTYLHAALGLDRKEFYEQVRPSWKLGIRFVWGARHVPHFYYPFDSRLDFQRDGLPRPDAYFCLRGMQDATPYSVLMERGRAPCYQRQGRFLVDEGFGYHLDNRAFLAYLEQQAAARGIEFQEGEVAGLVRREDGWARGVQLEDGRIHEADLFVDCSGFRSLLLGQALQQTYVDYHHVLPCDSAIVGSFPRNGPVLPYTTAETMDHGWCWRIELEDRVTRGYVYSSSFCTPEQAEQELRRKNPELTEPLRAIRFPSGRYENFWVDNVAAIGNASGFVEPLEATALHLVAEQLRLLCQGLMDSGGQIVPAMQRLQNRRYRFMWDDVRDFLAVHYKFNHRAETPFWEHCREQTPLGNAQEVVDLYQQVGPSLWAKKLISDDSMFGYTGYMNLLIGQKVPCHCPLPIDEEHWRRWEQYRDQLRLAQTACPPMREGLGMVHQPNWIW